MIKGDLLDETACSRCVPVPTICLINTITNMAAIEHKIARVPDPQVNSPDFGNRPVQGDFKIIGGYQSSQAVAGNVSLDRDIYTPIRERGILVKMETERSSLPNTFFKRKYRIA